MPHKLLNLIQLIGFRLVFRQFENDPKRNGHLGHLTPGFQQTYPQVLWTKRTPLILQVALDTPLRRLFDYLPPSGYGPGGTQPPIGVRVRVPFGKRQLLGILVGLIQESEVPAAKLRAATEILDQQPVLDPVTLEVLRWAAEYYHHPIGEVFAAALPVTLRAGQAAGSHVESWRITAAGQAELQNPSDKRAPAQRALLAWLNQHGPVQTGQLAAPFKAAQLKALSSRGWVAAQIDPGPAEHSSSLGGAPVTASALAATFALNVASSEVTLTYAQSEVIAAISASLGQFVAHLLFGVTGSGKTEVYLQVIATCIERGGQALLLVPEIGLTPQLVDRFRKRFSAGVVVLHSGLTNSDRRDAWRAAHSGQARVVIGTRSAVFTSMPNLRLIVVDEEHDASYKQHEGFRYSARDLAVMRARRGKLPIVLGSATPSLETLENVVQGRYQKLLLPQRPGAAKPPRMVLVDLTKHAVEQGLSQPAMQSIRKHLDADGQVIVFLNRRGYAPSLFCNACGWVAPCTHCDARMTLHRRAAQLRCHHCGAHSPVPLICGSCGQALHPVGQGTERIEETLTRIFPDAPLARLDRDTAGARGAIETVLTRVHSGEARILVGTQMLTKGHHFPEVTLVVILDADQGLFASDFRATERLAQTIIQVAGRAGREARAGEVLIQTEFPQHPLLNRLISAGYEAFALNALEERREAGWPPYTRLALLRAEAKDTVALDNFLRSAAAAGQALISPAQSPPVKIFGPATALIARRADYFRAHLLIEATNRGELQRFLAQWLPRVEAHGSPTAFRWSIDVDPLEVD